MCFKHLGWVECNMALLFYWMKIFGRSLHQRLQPAQNFWVYSESLSFFVLYSRLLADFLSHWGNRSNWSNLRLKMFFFALGRLKNHNVPHLHPNSTMFMPLERLQLKIYAFSGKFNVCSKRVLLSWIKICRDFTLPTQIFTQKYRSWLRFYSELLRKKLAAEGSGARKHSKVGGSFFYFFGSVLILKRDCLWKNFGLSLSQSFAGPCT